MTPEFRRQLGFKRSKVAHLIRHHVKESGYSLAELARRLNVSDVCVSRTINGTLHTDDVLDALLALGVPEKYLFDPRLVELPKLKCARKAQTAA